MCIEKMEASTERFFGTRYQPLGFPAPWKPFTDENDTAKLCQNATTAVHKHALRERRRKQRSRALKKEKRKPEHILPAGAMAPRNTTQYLMSNVYEDLKMDAALPAADEPRADSEALSPTTGSDSDSHFESVLHHQLRDFEELYGLAAKPE